jgi:hypothetical protein
MDLIGCEVSYKSGQLEPLETMVIVYLRGKTLTEKFLMVKGIEHEVIGSWQ